MSLDTDFRLYIDWDRDGFTEADNVTNLVAGVSNLTIGLVNPMAEHIAGVGSLTITLDNSERQFSPKNASSSYYGKLLPNLPVKVEAYSGANTWQLYYGVTQSWHPTSNKYGARVCDVVCTDRLGVLQDFSEIALPPLRDRTADFWVKAITAQVFGGGTATFDFLYDSGFGVLNWVEVDGVLFTFVASGPLAANEVLNGTTDADRVANFTAALNGGQGEGTLYGEGTLRPDTVRADSTLAVNEVTLRATAPGAWGNALTIRYEQQLVSPTVYSGTLSGGSDAPSGAIDCETGSLSFDFAADLWGGGDVNGLSALTDLALSEYGYIFQGRDGTIYFKNRYWIQELELETAIEIDNEQSLMNGELTILDLYNQVKVTYIPKTTLTAGVVARAQSAIDVPGQSGFERWNGTVVNPEGGTVTLKIPYVDPSTGQVVGATFVKTPEPSTDYTVIDEDEFDYTSSGRIGVSAVINAGDIELTFSNDALGPLIVNDLQVRGQAVIGYDPIQIIREDPTSIATYGKRSFPYDLPLASNQAFAETLADYLLQTQKSPQFRIRNVIIENPVELRDGNNPFSIGIGDVLELSDYQLAVTSERYVVLGITYTIDNRKVSSVTFEVKPLEDITRWFVGLSGSSELGTTTYLGL